MSKDGLARMKERDKSMRAARDNILRQVESWLGTMGFARVGAGHFTKPHGDLVCHIGFQKLSSGRNVRVMCHVTVGDHRENSISGPWSDAYACPNSPNNKKYSFGWSTREADMAKSVEQYCQYTEDVIFEWFNEQIAKTKA